MASLTSGSTPSPQPGEGAVPHATRRRRQASVGVVLLLIVFSAMAGCSVDSADETTLGDDDGGVETTESPTTAETETTNAPTTAMTEPSTTTTAETTPAAPSTAARPQAVMPDVPCGTNLQTAQDLVQDAGVFLSRSEDATGQGRSQLLDRNWTIIGQSPPPGSPIAEGDVVFQVVANEEFTGC